MSVVQGYFVDRGKDYMGNHEFVYVYQGPILSSADFRHHSFELCEEIYQWSKMMFGGMKFTYTDFGKCTTFWAVDDQAIMHFKLRYL